MISINSRRKSFYQVAMLHDGSITNINELSFGLEETTYTAFQRELRS
jgi:hypothetical protein